jgi:hypothetical protein
MVGVLELFVRKGDFPDEEAVFLGGLLDLRRCSP